MGRTSRIASITSESSSCVKSPAGHDPTKTVHRQGTQAGTQWSGQKQTVRNRLRHAGTVEEAQSANPFGKSTGTDTDKQKTDTRKQTDTNVVAAHTHAESSRTKSAHMHARTHAAYLHTASATRTTQ